MGGIKNARISTNRHKFKGGRRSKHQNVLKGIAFNTKIKSGGSTRIISASGQPTIVRTIISRIVNVFNKKVGEDTN